MRHAIEHSDLPPVTVPSTKSSEPAITTASVVGAVHTIAVVLGFLGFTTAETSISAEAQTIGAVVVGVVTLAFHLGAGAWVRRAVTPVADLERNAMSRLGGVLDFLGPLLNNLHTATANTAQLTEQVANRPVLVGGGGGGNGGGNGGGGHTFDFAPVVHGYSVSNPVVHGYSVSNPLVDTVSDEPDPEPDVISDEPDPEPDGGPGTTHGGESMRAAAPDPLPAASTGPSTPVDTPAP